MKNTHNYTLELIWLGDQHATHHREDRKYEILIDGKEKLKGSADKPFFGDPSLYNPEDLLMSALSSCHMMSFLYLCRKEGINVASYQDNPIGVLQLNLDGGGQFESVTLKPKVVFVDSTHDNQLEDLHKRAGKLCFIANSVNFEIQYDFQ